MRTLIVNTPFELMVAPNGARLKKSDHPAVPITPLEVANTAKACADVGASAIHVHVRDETGAHCLDPKRYSETIKAIRSQTPISIQVSTEAAGIFDIKAQERCLAEVETKDASISLREMSQDPDGLSKTYVMADARGIDMQHILYSPEEVAKLLGHFERNEIPQQSRRAIFVLGRYAQAQRSHPKDLEPFLDQLGEAHLKWSVCAFGPAEQDCLLAALNQGGHVRIGFENNRTAPDGSTFPDNQASVLSFVEAANKSGFQPQKVTQ